MVVLHPQVTIRTADYRAVLPSEVKLTAASRQAAWFAAFIAACYERDDAAAALALEDLLVGPNRSALIPHFMETRALAFRHGARAGGISGSGPSTFWVALSKESANEIAGALKDLMVGKGLDHSIHLSSVKHRAAYEIT